MPELISTVRKMMRDGLGSRTGPGSPPAPTPTILSKAVFIEEESLPHYRPQDWYPAKIGETLHGRYRIAVKLGYGSFSTVWLARDLRAWWKKCPFVVLKIITSGDGEESTAGTELEISRSIAKAKPTSEGRQYLRTAISSFKVNTPHETHMVLVYEPMRETLADLQLSYPNNRFPVHLLKTYVEMILTGLDDLHSQCKIIHTDLKPDNILVGIESKEVIWELVKAEAKDPSPRKEVGGGKTIHTRRAFGPMRSAPRAPKIADFGLSVHGDVEEPYYHTIQPEIYRAPEVVLRAGWTYSADIWNLGVVLWGLLENRELFNAKDPITGAYDPILHLHEMTSLLGPPPPKFLERGRRTPEYYNSRGELRTDDDKVLPTGLPSLYNSVTGPFEDALDRQLFVSFVRRMLQWSPEERSTTKQLLQDPWLLVET